jgi:hypothetical protein
MAIQNHKEIDQTAQSLGRAYHHLQSAYCELAQLDDNWPKGLNEYLYEEAYNKVDFATFVRVMVLDLEEMQAPLQSFTHDVQYLSAGLSRVGRGESFSV